MRSRISTHAGTVRAVTGSVDALLQVRKTGLTRVLVTGPDVAVPPGRHDVVGIAGVARSLPRMDESDLRLHLARQTSLRIGSVRSAGGTAAAHLRDIEVVVKGGQMGHLELFDDVRRGRWVDAH